MVHGPTSHPAVTLKRCRGAMLLPLSETSMKLTVGRCPTQTGLKQNKQMWKPICSMCVCVYVCMYVCMYVYDIYAYMCVYIYIYICIHMAYLFAGHPSLHVPLVLYMLRWCGAIYSITWIIQMATTNICQVIPQTPPVIFRIPSPETNHPPI